VPAGACGLAVIFYALFFRTLDHGTRKTTLLLTLPFASATVTSPVVAPVGTVVVISEFEATLNVAGTPLKETLVAPFRFVPGTGQRTSTHRHRCVSAAQHHGLDTPQQGGTCCAEERCWQ
jgi:hypothetical protein